MIKIKHIINSGVYEVNLQGTSNAEFKGEHPCIIISTIKEPDIFIIIPLTTYTEEKWQKLRQMLCCRILSTNSIARIDKMQIRHKNNIPKRWFKQYKLVIPQYDEMKKVHEKALKYFELSFDKSLRSYDKYYKQYSNFKMLCDKFFNVKDIVEEFSVVAKDSDNIMAIYNLSQLNHISFDDVKNIIYEFINKSEVLIAYEYVKQELQITINKNYKNYLTLCNKYDIF